MDYEEADHLDGAAIRVPKDEGYRTCPACDGDCEPDVSFGSDESGARIAFICPEHGVHSVIDLFEGQR